MKPRVAHLTIVDLGVLWLLPQLRALRDAGYEVEVICPDGPRLAEIEGEGFVVRRMIQPKRTISFLHDLFVFFHLVWIIRKGKYTILHAHTAKMEFIGQLAARLVATPVVVYTNHGFIFRAKMNSLKRKFLINMARLAGRFSDHVLSQSSEDIETALEQRIYFPGHLSYLGNGIDLSQFDARRFKPEDIFAKKQELGIPEHDQVVGMVGRFVWEKGYREFFEAARIIGDQKPRVTFLVIGVPLESERDPLNFRILHELGIEDHFRVLTSRRDMPELYSVMDVVALPSYREGFPRTLMEAAAMSRPTVATDIPGCREAVCDGRNGLLVPIRDSISLANKITLLLEDPEAAERMGKQGRQLAEERFDERKVVARLIACYGKLLQARHLASAGSLVLMK